MKLWAYIALLAVTGGAQSRRPGDIQPAASPFVRDFLDAHNDVRSRVGVGPLVWSEHLAAEAQNWAETLAARNQFRHTPNSSYGQNLFSSTRREAPSQVIDAWASEARDYSYSSNRCRGVCGHYTQIIWSTTREVGCGVARGGGREVWVCNYNPPGNWVGKRPY